MEYFFEHVKNPTLMIVLVCINIAYFLFSVVMWCAKEKQMFKYMLSYLIATILMYAAIWYFNGATSMFATAILDLVFMMFACVAVLAIIGIAASILGILMLYKRHNPKTKAA